MSARRLPVFSRHFVPFRPRWPGIPALLLTLLPALALGQASDMTYAFTTLASRASIGSEDGIGDAARFNSPQGVAVDRAGNVYVADTGNHTIRKITPARVVTTIAGCPGQPGSADGIGGAARFQFPYAVVVDSANNLYVADTGNHAIRQITPTGLVTTFAGAPGLTGLVDGPRAAARFNKPEGLAISPNGSLYVADSGNGALRRISPTGATTTLADGSSGLVGVRCLAVDSAEYVFAGSYNRIQKISPGGVVTTLAGGGYGNDDGTGAAAGFYQLTGLVLDSAGILWAADEYNIRRITPDGIVRTAAWSDTNFGGVNDAGSDPQFGPPVGLARDAAGDLYFADIANTIHRMPAGSPGATMLAGFPGQRSPSDGTGSNARFDYPTSLAVNDSRHVFVADDSSIREITPEGVVSTLAGHHNYIPQNGTGVGAAFTHLDGITADRLGNLYAIDNWINGFVSIRKITMTDGIVTTAPAGSVGAYDPYHRITGIAADDSGNVFIAIPGKAIIQKVTATGEVSTFAGSYGQWGAADGTGEAARFGFPTALASDRDNNIYVLDTANSGSIRKISPAGVVTTIATGLTQNSEWPPVAPSKIYHLPPQTDSPRSIAVDDAGNIYLTYYYLHIIRKIDPSGAITTIGGIAGEAGSADGIGSAARFDGPDGIAVDDAGTIYLVDTLQSTVRTGRLTGLPVIASPPANLTKTAGQKATYSVTLGSNPATAYQWQRQAGSSADWTDLHDDAAFSGTGTATLTVDSVTAAMNGDSFRCVVTNASGSVTSEGATLTVVGGTPLTVNTLAGQAGISGSADGAGSAARFSAPADLAVDGAGNVYVADTDNHTIRRITPAGVVTTLAGQAGSPGNADGTGPAAQFNHPAGVAADSAGNLFVSDTDNDTIRRVSPAGVVTTLAGQAGTPGSADGPGATARFNGPSGIVVDATGDLYVADTLNNAIRRISPTGMVTTAYPPIQIAGGPWLSGPQGLTLDHAGNLYVAHTNSSQIQKLVLATATLTSAAGSGITGSEDGPAPLARFNYPSGVAVDGTGNLYVADTDNHAIRQVTPAGAVSTIAGLVGTSGSADGVGTAARFYYPTGIAVDDTGNLYIADTNNHTIRLAYFAAAPAIRVQPQSQSVAAGSAVQFSVTVSGRPAPTCQWYFNGTAIAGATSSVLSLGNAQPANAGSYTVMVSNDSGSATSNAATLTVNSAPSGSTVGVSASGGGAMDTWFVGLLALLAATQTRTRKKSGRSVLPGGETL